MMINGNNNISSMNVNLQLLRFKHNVQDKQTFIPFINERVVLHAEFPWKSRTGYARCGPAPLPAVVARSIQEYKEEEDEEEKWGDHGRHTAVSQQRERVDRTDDGGGSGR